VLLRRLFTLHPALVGFDVRFWVRRVNGEVGMGGLDDDDEGMVQGIVQ